MITVASRRSADDSGAAALTLTVVTAPGDACQVLLSGCLDGTTVELAVAVLEYEHRCGRRRLRVDLTGVEHAEPDAIDVLAMARRTLLGTGATLEVMGLRPHVLTGRRLVAVRTRLG